MSTQMVDQAWQYPHPTYGSIWICKSHTGYWFACTEHPTNINDKWWDIPANIKYLPIESLRTDVTAFRIQYAVSSFIDQTPTPNWERTVTNNQQSIQSQSRWIAIMEK